MTVNWATVLASFLAAGGGSAAIAFGIFKLLGERWIDNRFAKQLEQSRQDHATQTEHLRFKMTGLLDRATKLNQREFEVLPEIWGKTDAAYGAAAYFLAPGRMHPDFDQMGDRQFEEIMVGLDIPDFRKDEIRGAAPRDRLQAYSDAMRWADLHRAQTAAREFSSALSQGSIYLNPDTHERLKEFELRLVNGIFDQKVEMQFPRQPGDAPREDDDAKAFRNNGQAWFKELGDFLRDKYWGIGSKSLPSV